MRKKIMTSLLALLLIVALLPISAVFFSVNVEAVYGIGTYLSDCDYFSMSPAEKWIGGSSTSIYTTTWAVNVENGGHVNGQAIHLWNAGSNSKFRVWGMRGDNTFRIQSTSGRFWDVSGRSEDAGANIHIWSGRKEDENDDSQRFYLVEDSDGVSDTFYVKNLNSGKYLAPKNYFKNPGNNSSEKDNWDEDDGCQLIQSSFSFRWRIRLGNREARYSVPYFKSNDFFVVSPAEKWIGDDRCIIPSAEWEVTAQSEGIVNGSDIQMYKYGVSSKFLIRNLDSRNNTFQIQITNFQETKAGKYWDVEDRSMLPGANIHAWTGRSIEDDYDSQRFFLMNDYDDDPETFYIKNLNSGKYLAPENYFINPSNDSGKNLNWDSDGTNIIQSNYAFRWRFHVLNREVSGTTDYTNWMSRLSDNTYLSQLSIPGTHDSSTANVDGGEVSGFNFYSCQKYFFDEQLFAGIRAFDLRVNEIPETGKIVMVHGGGVCNEAGRDGADDLTLKTVLNELLSFLANHKNETIIVTLKIDDELADPIAFKRRLAKLLLDQYITMSDTEDHFYQWYDDATGSPSTMHSPMLSEVRGKIVLISRIDFTDDLINDDFDTYQLNLLHSYTGPDITKWDANYSDDRQYAQVISPSDCGVRVLVQDDWRTNVLVKLYQFTNTIKQLNGVLDDDEELADAPIPSLRDFVFNYTSMTLGTGGLTPLEAARHINDLFFHSTSVSNNQRLGIVMMDFANKALASVIIRKNDKYVHTAGSSLYHFTIIGGVVHFNSAPDGLASYTKGQPQLTGTDSGIAWPASASVTYGYILNEATLNFADPDAQNAVPGFFYFENGTDILTVKDDNGKNQTLVFRSFDGTVNETAQIPVTVNPRYLPITVGNYQVEYGETFDITQTSYPYAGGYFLSSDREKLDLITAAAGLHHKAVDDNGNDITITADTKPCTGTIRLIADRPDEVVHPNYDVSVENGTWMIMPRTVSVSWNETENGWEASIGNIINDDDVVAVVTPDSDGKGATLTLSGEDAGAYRIAEGANISPDNSGTPETSASSLYAVLSLFGILLFGSCGCLLFKKIRTEE